jgi:hypothetical protein
MSRQFTRTIEDFTCGHCGFQVQGTGYTNHCPRCLWSKHVDVNPGDRSESCHGLMEPVRVEKHGADLYIIQRCVQCHAQRRIKPADADDRDLLIQLSAAI